MRVLMADDHAVVRAGLRTLFSTQGDVVCLGEARDATETLQKAIELKPDVVVMDLSMPGGGGVRVISELRKEVPRARVLVFTMHNDTAYLQACLAAGAAGYLVKTASDQEVLEAIHAIHAGRVFVRLQGSANSPDVPAMQASSEAKHLSNREREVLCQLARGHTNQEIAEQLHLSVKTIETYRARIAEKLGLRSRSEITRYAMELGLLNSSKE